MKRLKYPNLTRLVHFLPVGIRQRYPRGWTTVQFAQTGDIESTDSSDLFYSATSSVSSKSIDRSSELSRGKPIKTIEEDNSSMGDKKQIDYILVTTKKILANEGKAKKIHNFVNSLSDIGVNIEMDYGKAHPDHLFIKLHIPDDLINHLSSLYHVELSYTNPNYSSERKPRFKVFQTELDLKDESDIAHRAPESVMDLRPTRPTNAERSMLLYTLMTKTWFDANVEDYGIERMLSRGLLVAGYPVHEGGYRWTTEGPLTDRQLLWRYWANFVCIHKKQPLNLVEKYFGTEVAIYFAYTDFYFKYMIPAALIGLLFFIGSIISANLGSYDSIEKEICDSDIRLCPMCQDRTMCKYTNFSDHCIVQKYRALFDNVFSSIFAMIMAVWAVLFVFFWKRRLNMLRLRWNVFKVRLEKGMRPEFLAKANKTRLNTATGVQEHYIPRYKRCFILGSTHFCMAFIACCFMLFAMGVVVYENRLTHTITQSDDEETVQKAKLVKMIVNAILIVVQIFIFSMSYPKIAYFFAKMEVPASQYLFDNSYIVKYCILLFANCYSAIAYLTFVKGRSYEHPGAVHENAFVRAVISDLCGPSGCFTDLALTLLAIFVMASLKSMVLQIVVPLFKLMYRQLKAKTIDLPQWELDFVLVPVNKYALFWEYFDLLVQYGYLVCFVAAFPLAPLLAVIRNAFEVRIDATKYVLFHRRYTPKKVRGMGSYNKLLNWMTYIGIFVNACVIAFSSSFISWILYKFYFKTEGGYYKFMLSEYDTADLPVKTPEDNGTCYYEGMRYPPSDARKYDLNAEYYIILVSKLVFILVYEQVLVFIRAVVRSSLHEKPKAVKEKLLHQDDLVREARQKILNDFYTEAAAKKFSDSVKFPAT